MMVIHADLALTIAKYLSFDIGLLFRKLDKLYNMYARILYGE